VSSHQLRGRAGILAVPAVEAWLPPSKKTRGEPLRRRNLLPDMPRPPQQEWATPGPLLRSRANVASTGSRRSRGARSRCPFNFLENNPIQVVFRCASCSKTRRNWLRLPNVRFHPGSSCPSAALRRSHTRGPKATAISARFHALVGIRSIFGVPHLAQSSEHPNTFTSFRRPHA
jgi:hypothetical protein